MNTDEPSPQLNSWLDGWRSQAGSERTLRVRWLLNPEREVLQNVEVTELNGNIVDIRAFDQASTLGVLPLVLIPPLVNAHTHLEFSAITNPLLPAQPFPDWIQAVMQWRGDTTQTAQESIASGLNESAAEGVWAMGEIATQSDDSLIPRPGSVLMQFRELIGLRPERIEQQLQLAETHLSTRSEGDPHDAGFPVPESASSMRVRALSPHSPYTVHPDLLNAVMELAVQYQVPVAMHLAETPDEIELLSSGHGRFEQFLSRLGLFDRSTFPGGRSVLQFLQQLVKAPRALAVHGNYFTDCDIEFLTAHKNITTVYCPRTHRFFGHSKHPLSKLLKAGCRVILGTDSRASNPDLSIWRELQHVASNNQEFSAGRLLAMITTHAAEGMGLNALSYQIQAGRSLRLNFLRFDPGLTTIDQIVWDSQTRIWSPQASGVQSHRREPAL